MMSGICVWREPIIQEMLPLAKNKDWQMSYFVTVRDRKIEQALQ